MLGAEERKSDIGNGTGQGARSDHNPFPMLNIRACGLPSLVSWILLPFNAILSPLERHFQPNPQFFELKKNIIGT